MKAKSWNGKRSTVDGMTKPLVWTPLGWKYKCRSRSLAAVRRFSEAEINLVQGLIPAVFHWASDQMTIKRLQVTCIGHYQYKNQDHRVLTKPATAKDESGGLLCWNQWKYKSVQGQPYLPNSSLWGHSTRSGKPQFTCRPRLIRRLSFG